MGRPASLALALVATLAALVALAGAAGEALTPPGMFSTQGLDCAYRCWQGIIPGATTVEEAEHLLARSAFVLPGSVRFERAELRWLTAQGWSGRAAISGGVVASLDLYGAFALGDLISDLGPPGAAWIRYTRDLRSDEQVKAWFFYPEMGVSLETLGGRPGPPLLTPELLIRGVYYRAENGGPWSRFALWKDSAAPWEGFALGRYQAGTTGRR